jgi:hypothetical protein
VAIGQIEHLILGQRAIERVLLDEKIERQLLVDDRRIEPALGGGD